LQIRRASVGFFSPRQRNGPQLAPKLQLSPNAARLIGHGSQERKERIEITLHVVILKNVGFADRNQRVRPKHEARCARMVVNESKASWLPGRCFPVAAVPETDREISRRITSEQVVEEGSSRS